MSDTARTGGPFDRPYVHDRTSASAFHLEAIPRLETSPDDTWRFHAYSRKVKDRFLTYSYFGDVLKVAPMRTKGKLGRPHAKKFSIKGRWYKRHCVSEPTRWSSSYDVKGFVISQDDPESSSKQTMTIIKLLPTTLL